MPLTAALIRPMLTSDLDAVMRIQATCHLPDYHEPREAFANKLAQAPDGAWVAEQHGQVSAYLWCLPIDEDHLPVLHASDWQAPRQPRWLYLHDLAVAPEARGTGAGHRLVAQAAALAHRWALEGLALVAVGDAHAYWHRQGFHAVALSHPGLQRSLSSFGTNARFMIRIKLDA